MALTRKGSPFVWTDRLQQAFEALKACLISAPILGFPTENELFVLDTDASLFAMGGVLSQLQDDREVVIAYASRSLHLSQRRYCMTRREMLVTVVMCTHFRSYLRGGGGLSSQGVDPGSIRAIGLSLSKTQIHHTERIHVHLERSARIVGSPHRGICWACSRYAPIAEPCPRPVVITNTVLCQVKAVQSAKV